MEAYKEFIGTLQNSGYCLAKDYTDYTCILLYSILYTIYSMVLYFAELYYTYYVILYCIR